MPLLSIITVCLNDERGLNDTIQSVVMQTFTDFELIVVDGGSTDGSVDIIKQQRESRLKWISQKDNGIFNAQNKGINLASGKYCLFLNSGDTLYNENTLADVFDAENEEDIIYGNMLIVYPDEISRIGKMPSRLTFKHMIRDTLWHPVSFIKRELFSVIGNYDESFKIVSDYDFFLRAVLLHHAKTKHLHRIISRFKMGGASSIRENFEALNRERTFVQLKYFDKREVDKALRIPFIERQWIRIKRKLEL